MQNIALILQRSNIHTDQQKGSKESRLALTLGVILGTYSMLAGHCSHFTEKGFTEISEYTAYVMIPNLTAFRL